jgi:hypothetical protein
MEKAALLLVVVAVALTGCVGSSVSPEEVRDGFLGDGNNVSSYVHEGEVTFESSPVRGTGARIQNIKTDAVLDYENRELRAEIASRGGTPGNVTTIRETTSYIVNGTGYTRTVPGSGGWVKAGDPLAVNRTWEARDEIGFYTGVLRKASVSMVSGEQETVNGAEAHVLDVELNESERTDFLTGELSDRPEFLNQLRMEEFNSTVWVSKEKNRLLRAETEVSAVAPNARVGQRGQRRMDIRTELSFVDEFRYGESVDIGLPEGARDAAT